MRRLKGLIWTTGSGKAVWKGWLYSLGLTGQARRTSGNLRLGDVKEKSLELVNWVGFRLKLAGEIAMGYPRNGNKRKGSFCRPNFSLEKLADTSVQDIW